MKLQYLAVVVCTTGFPLALAGYTNVDFVAGQLSGLFLVWLTRVSP